MYFKNLTKSIEKIVACMLAAVITIGASTYSNGPNRNKLAASADPNITTFIGPVECVEPITTTTTTTETTTATTVTTFSTTTNTTETSTTTTTTITTTDITTSFSTTGEVTMISSTEMTSYYEEAFTNEEIYETPAEEVEYVEDVDETPEMMEREYLVYKPSTHYIHRNTCRWCNDECYEIDSAEGLEARKCSECNPDIEIDTLYEAPVETSTTSTAISVTDYEYVMLCNLVAGEYGSDWVSTYDKGAIVATVIHRMWEGTRWTGGAPASIYNVIAAPYQYDGKYLDSCYSYNVTQSCKDAVTYALNNIGDYDYYTNPDGTSVYMINSFYGDGTYNWFRCS